MAEPRGVAYLFCGDGGYSERMAVSLFTLREHYAGPVTIFACGETCEQMAKRLASSLELTVRPGVLAESRRHAAYLTKTLVPTWSEYRHTVLIDGDTVIVGPFDELFGPPLAITRFSDWVSNGRRVANRVAWFRGKSPAIDLLVDAQLNHPHPAINTGVMGWAKDEPALADWHAITTAAAGTHMTDEIAMQLLHTEVPECKIFDDRFNCSPIYGTPEGRADVRIWHFHGGKHVRKEPGRSMWWPVFERVLRANPGGLQDWAGMYDKDVKKELTRCGLN